MKNINEKYGYWESNSLKFNNKIDALRYGTKNKFEVKFVYHDELWKNFDRNLLGKVSLKQLYKERAQQLRDSYEYLVLYYSGGADSHNILMTFIENDIKLDEVRIKWPKEIIDSNVYTPNISDRSSRNIWSEWDYVIKPSLEWLRSNHPEIKIEIKDHIENLDVKHLESVIESVSHTRGGFLHSFTSINGSIVKQKVGHIFGIDKPALGISGDDVYMFFNDLTMTMLFADLTKNCDPNSIECFYWSPDFPLLTFEMAYQTIQYFNLNKDKRKFLHDIDVETNSRIYTKGLLSSGFHTALSTQIQNNIVKMVCYGDTWDFSKFQADKPTSANRQEKWFWFFENQEFKDVREAFYSNIKLHTNSLGSEFLTNYNSTFTGIKIMFSDFHYVGKLSLQEEE
jgi:hypothetical protein